MYEYVKTETGWVLCWGGAALYNATRSAPVLTVEVKAESAASEEPVNALSA